MTPNTAFEIEVPTDIDPDQTLLIGLSAPGMGALTAADQLISQQPSTQIGHISPDELPAITPFEDGRPRHHTRLYNITDEDIIVLVSDLFVPVWAAKSLVEDLAEWVSAVDIEEIALLHSVPYPHGPEQHDVFQVATDEYRDKQLSEVQIPTLGGGVLDGVPGEILRRSLDKEIPPAGVFVTPAHPPGPDVDSAGLFLDTIEEVYNVSIDRDELEKLSEEIKQRYETLAERMAAVTESEEARAEREFYADRMYM